jgi:hypothetical protein
LREAEKVEPGVHEFVAAGVLGPLELEPIPFFGNRTRMRFI